MTHEIGDEIGLVSRRSLRSQDRTGVIKKLFARSGVSLRNASTIVQQVAAVPAIFKGGSDDDQGLVSHIGPGPWNPLRQEPERVNLRQVRRFDPLSEISVSG